MRGKRTLAGRREGRRQIRRKAVLERLDNVCIIVPGHQETDLTVLRLEMMLNIRLMNEQGRLADDQQHSDDPVVETVYH
jgi:hypothetical protein